MSNKRINVLQEETTLDVNDNLIVDRTAYVEAKKTKLQTVISFISSSIASVFVPKTTYDSFVVNTNNHFTSTDGAVSQEITDRIAADALKQSTSERNQPSGYAGLDGGGKVPSSLLPSYVDDVIEVANFVALPGTGESGKIYITLDTNFEYRWGGSSYVQIVASPGTTDAVTEGSTNKYFTVARVLATALTGIGFSTATAVIATDTILQAIGKIQAQITALYKIPTGGTTGQVLAKIDSANGNTQWVTVSGGGGSGDITPDTIKVNTPLFTGPGGHFYLYGDSIGSGSVLPDPTKRFSTLFATKLGMTEHNLAITGTNASAIDLSTIPTKGVNDKYIIIEFGTNDFLSGRTTTQFQTDLNAIVTNAIGKGWAGSDFIFMSIFYSLYSAAQDTGIRAMNTVIQSTATANSALYIDCYDGLNNLFATYSQLAQDAIHPNTAANKTVADLLLSRFPQVFDSSGQSGVVNGILDVDRLHLTKFNNLSGVGNQKYLLGVDANGIVGVVKSIGDIKLNNTYLAGNLIQSTATPPSSYQDKIDILLAALTKIYWVGGAGPTLFVQIAPTANLDLELSTNFATANINFYTAGSHTVSGGRVVALQIDDLGYTIASKGFKTRPTIPIIGIGGAGNDNSIMPNVGNTGNMEFHVSYTTGKYIWFVSGGTTNNKKQAIILNQNGRMLLEFDGAGSDIASAKLALNSTTEGFLVPRMTTTQKNAIASPAEGLEVYDLTLHKKCIYTGSAWETITSV